MTSFAFRCLLLLKKEDATLLKVVRGEGEEAKVAVRNLLEETLTTKIAALVKEKEISEDEQRRAETEIQKLTDKYITEVDKLVAEKEKEIMTV